MATLGKAQGKITFNSNVTVNVVEQAGPTKNGLVLIAAGSYYWETATALTTQIANALTNDATLGGTYTCTLDAGADTSTGKLTISATGVGTGFTITTFSGSRAVLGFTSDLTPSATTFTGQNAVQFLWMPDVKRGPALAPTGVTGKLLTDGTITVAPSGKSTALYYTSRRVDHFAFRYLKANKVWSTNETTVNESWEQFFSQVVGQGIPFRWHDDRNTASYVDYRALRMADMGAVADFPAMTSGAAAHYSINTDVINYV